MSILLAASAAADPGLALYRFGGGNGRFLKCVREGTITNGFRSYLDRKCKDSWARGTLTVPADGEYRFKTVANRMMMRLDGVEYFFRDRTDLVEHAVALSKGPHRFEIFMSNRIPFGRDGDMTVYWRRPGDADFSAIPPESFSHGAGDRGLKTPIVSDLVVRVLDSSGCYVKYAFEVGEPGFYRVRIRRAGMFRWSVPGVPTGVWIDGEQRRHFYVAPEFGDDFFDDNVVVAHFTRGEHRLELRGENVQCYLKERPRVWMTRIDPVREAAATFCVTEKLQGETVFRMGEDVEWRIVRSTLDRTEPLEIAARVVRQRTGEAVWEGRTTLKPGLASAEGVIAFPKNLSGVFEYSFVSGGRTLEGPWEFCVIDTEPPKAPAVDPAAPLPSLETFGRKVDEIDFGSEGLGGEHHIRDNGTSKTVAAGGVRYRETGPMRKNTHYCNVDSRDGTLPVPIIAGWTKNARTPDGRKPYGRTKYLSASDWFAATLKVRHPQMAHVAVAYLPNDVYRRFPVQLQDCKTAHSNGAYYEILPADEPGLVKMCIPFWPNADIDLLMVPSDTHGHPRCSTAAIAKIELYECPEGFPAMPEAVAGWNPKRHSGWGGEQGDLSPERTSTPPIPDDGDWFAPDWSSDKSPHHPVWYDFTAYTLAWQRFGEYARWQGQNFLQWPIWSYNMAHVQTERLPWGSGLFQRGFGWRPVDKYVRNSMKIILLTCEKYGVDFWGDMQINYNPGREIAKGGTLNELRTNNTLVATVWSTEGVKDARELEGCFLTEGNRLGGNLNPAHPVGRRYLVHFYGDIARFCRNLPAFKGVNIRQWNACSSCMSAWWCSALAGYDDWTLNAFAAESGVRCPAAVRATADRQSWYMTNGAVRAKWFDWRAEKVASLRREILDEVRKYRPDATLRAAVQGEFAPVKDLGMGLDRGRLTKDLGFNTAEGSIRVQGNEMCALDPVVFKGYDIRPQVVHTNEPLWGVRCPSHYLNGLCTGSGMLAPPYSTKGFAEAMAVGALDCAYWGTYWAYPADNVEVREFVRAMRAVPDLTFERVGPDDPDAPVVCRRAGGTAYFVSLRPYAQKVALAAEAEDLVRGGKSGTLDLPPFGLRLVRTARPLEGFRLVSGERRGDVGSPDKSALRTLRIVVRNESGRARPRTVCTVRGGVLIGNGVTSGALKLFRDGREIPLQIDRCDGRGNYLPADASAPLGARDEVCFLHDFAEGETTAVFALTEGGRPTAAVKSPFSSSRDAEVYDSNHTLHTNGMLRVSCGDLEVEFCGLAVSRLAWKGRAGFDGAHGKPRARNYMGGLPPALAFILPSEARVRLAREGVRLIAAGPVRALVGVELPGGGIYSKPMRGERNDLVYPAFTGFRAALTWQIPAGGDTVSSRLRFTWDECWMPGLEMLWWQDSSYRRPSSPMEGKKLYAGSASDPAEFVWDVPVKGRGCWGEKSCTSSTWYVFYDAATGSAYGEAMDPPLAARGGFSLGRFRSSVMEMRGMSAKNGTADFRRAYRAWEGDPGVKSAAAWAVSAFAPEAVVTVE